MRSAGRQEARGWDEAVSGETQREEGPLRLCAALR